MLYEATVERCGRVSILNATADDSLDFLLQWMLDLRSDLSYPTSMEGDLLCSLFSRLVRTCLVLSHIGVGLLDIQIQIQKLRSLLVKLNVQISV